MWPLVQGILPGPPRTRRSGWCSARAVDLLQARLDLPVAERFQGASLAQVHLRLVRLLGELSCRASLSQ
eukprot:7166941-Alexandrium_andersonii.AAC.1